MSIDIYLRKSLNILICLNLPHFNCLKYFKNNLLDNYEWINFNLTQRIQNLMRMKRTSQ